MKQLPLCTLQKDKLESLLKDKLVHVAEGGSSHGPRWSWNMKVCAKWGNIDLIFMTKVFDLIIVC